MASFQLTASILKHSQDAILTLSPDGRISTWNPAAERLFGYSAAEAIGQDINLIISEDRVKVTKQFMRRVLNGEEVPPAEVICRRKGGTLINVRMVHSGSPDDKGRIGAILLIGHDVTKDKIAERQIRETNDLLTAIFDGTSDVVTLKDKDGTFLLVNRAFCELMKKDKHEIVGRHFRDVFPADATALIDTNEKEVLASRKPLMFEEHFRLQGKHVAFLVTRAPRLSSDGEVIGTISICRDITERIEILEYVAHLQRLDAIGKLADGVAHDFNNLLMAIGSCAELIEEMSRPQPEIEKYAIQIKNTTARGASLTQQLLALGRQQPTAPKVLTLNSVVQDTATIVKRLMGEQIQISFSTLSQWKVKVDPGHFQQVIINLCLNARDAMPDGGKLVIETSDAVIDTAYAGRHAPLQPGRYVLLTVSDTGSGMTPDVKARVFEPFFTTKAAGKGTGLGLAMVYGIVKQSDGFTYVYSEPGLGSSFKIFLPVSDSETEEPSATETQTAEPSNKVANILLVEDEAPLRAVLRDYLVGKGHRVWEASSGAEAIEIADRSETEFDLLLTDLVMPGMTGIDTALEIRKRHSRAAIVCMSGYSERLIDIPLTIKASFVQKPIALKELLRVVESCASRPNPGNGSKGVLG